MSRLVINALRPWSFRGKLRLTGALVPSSGTIRQTVFGTEMELDLSDAIQRQIYLGCYEPNETRTFKRILRPGSTLIDVGANVGYFTALGAKLVGSSGRVIAVEPSPYAFNKLDTMVRGSGLEPRVKAVNIGLGDVDGELSLYLPPATAHNHSPSMVPTSESTAVTVPVRTLAACLGEWEIPDVDLLKIDVEGFEPRVLLGAWSALASGRIRNVLVEFNDQWLRKAGSSPQQLYAMLRNAGFHEALADAEVGRFAAGCVVTRWMKWKAA